jgi:UDP-glucose 4-epimerase
MRSCLVIGGYGFIGRELIRLLLASGRKVTVLGRRSQPSAEISQGCAYVSGDYGNAGILRGLLTAGIEVIDLAYSTVPKTSYGDPVFDLLSNLPASVGLLQECHLAGVSKIVLVSSGGTVYGHSRFLPITEDHPTEPVSPYGITKLTIDRYAQMFFKTLDLPVAVARPANAYGETQRPGLGQGFLAEAIDAVLHGREVPVFGAQGSVRDYIHVRDVATGILAVLDSGEPGQVYNIGTGNGTSNLEALQIVEDLSCPVGYPVKINTLPLRRFDVQSNILSSAKLQKISNWNPKISIREGIHKMWNFALKKAGHTIVKDAIDSKHENPSYS